MKKLFLIYLISISFLLNCKTHAQFNQDSLQVRINRIVKNYVDTNKAGVIVGVIRKEGSGTLFEHRYSYGHIRSDTTSPRPDSLTIFQLGSVTKSFTATILSMLIQQGGPLNLNELVEDHLPLNLVRAPVFVTNTGDTVRMTILDLATHFSALPDDPILPIHDTTTYQMMYNYLNNHTLARAPGQCFLYSNLGVSLLGVVISNTLGKIIDSLFIQRLSDPINMPDTRVTLTTEQKTRLAQGYVSGTTEGPFHKPSWPAFIAAGGLYTTIDDFLKYLQFQMGLSGLGMNEILDSAHLKRRVTNDTCMEPNATGRVGLVWQMNILNPQIDSTFYYTWKNGGTAAFSSYIGFADNTSQNLKTGVVMLSNHLSPSCDKMAIQILRYLNSDTTEVNVNLISENIADNYKLEQNYPNPFNPKTMINFQCSMFNFVSLKVYDALGKQVAELVNEKLSPGTYQVTFDGSNLPSGIYFYKLESEDYVMTRKMMLIK